MKQYIVRANNYEYNDENYYIESSGQFIDGFTSQQEAIVLRDELNVKELKETEGLYDFFFNSGNEDEKSKWLIQYYKSEFNIELETFGDGHDEIQELPFPNTATNEQLLAIINTIGIRFYEVYEFDDNQPVVELVPNPEFWGECDYDPLSSNNEYHSFYFSETEAVGYVGDSLTNAFYEPIAALYGSLEELSDTPNILAGVLSNSVNFIFKGDCIALKPGVYYITPIELMSVTSLLKVKPYFVKEYTFETAKHLTTKRKQPYKGIATPQNARNLNSHTQTSDKKWWEFWK